MSFIQTETVNTVHAENIIRDYFQSGFFINQYFLVIDHNTMYMCILDLTSPLCITYGHVGKVLFHLILLK